MLHELHRVFRVRVGTPLLLLFAAVLALALVLVPGRAHHWADSLSMRLSPGGTSMVLATAGAQGMYHRLGVMLQDVLDERGPYKVTLLDTAGSIENLALLRRGEADFAFIQGGLGVPLDRVAVVAAVERQYTHLIVPADAKIQRFHDLQGKRVGVGPPGSDFDSFAERVFGFYRFHDAPILVNDHNRDLAQAFLDGEIDAAFTVYSLFTPAIESLLDTGWYRIVPIDGADGAARYLPQIDPAYLPSGLYGPDRSLPAPETGPFSTLAVDTLLVARADAHPRAVAALLDGLHHPEFLRLARLDAPPDRARVEGGRAQVHPAALRYYARNDPVSAELFEIASLFLAGLLGLLSLGHYAAGRLRQHRRDRKRRAIRPYFERMLDFGNGVEAAGDAIVLRGLLHDMMAVQREAECAWLRGKLDTEDMENLYAAYAIRSGNALQKSQNLLLEATFSRNDRNPSQEPPLEDPPYPLPRVEPAPLPPAEQKAAVVAEVSDQGNADPDATVEDTVAARRNARKANLRGSMPRKRTSGDPEDPGGPAQLPLF